MIDAQIKLIEAELDVARVHLEEIEAACEALKQTGMFDSLPHFQWQARNGEEEKRYLYLVYRQNGVNYAGPNGQRKVYVGCDPAKTAEARRMERNTTTWKGLRLRAFELRRWIECRELDLKFITKTVDRLAAEARKWPCTPIPAPND